MPKDEGLSRRDLLKKGGAAAAAVGLGGPPFSFAGPLRFARRQLKGDLSIIQWIHPLQSYDAWFDGTWAATWGEQNDVQVQVDHVKSALLDTQAAAEVKARAGHDLFMNVHPMPAYEDLVIDHASVVAEIERAVGPYGHVGKRSTYNPRTKKYFAVADSYVPAPVIWRHDLWNSIGESPFTWDHVRRAAPKLKALGHPIGIGQSPELDSNVALLSYLLGYGAFVQNAHNRPTLDTKHTVQAVKLMAGLYAKGEDPAIFGWNPSSNDRYLYAGTGSLIVDSIAATRTAEATGLPFAGELWLWPAPYGPHGRLGLEQVTACYSIWEFAQNRDNAQKFLADLCVAGKDATLASQLYNFPSFPGAFPFADIRQAAAADPHPPNGKYSILTTIAETYTRNVGYPGTRNAAMEEVFAGHLVPQMFARVSQGTMSAADSVALAARQVDRIYAKWKARKKI